MTDSFHLTVRVRLRNDEGDYRIHFGQGESVTQAVEEAEWQARAETDDDSFVMDEWWAA